MVSALQDKYRIDLTMFEYDAEEYMQLASESEGFMPDQIWKNMWYCKWHYLDSCQLLWCSLKNYVDNLNALRIQSLKDRYLDELLERRVDERIDT